MWIGARLSDCHAKRRCYTYRMNEGQSISIWYENLAVLDVNKRLPLSALTAAAHIPGELRFQIGGRPVPCLGYFGPDDVCFNTWLEELGAAARAFESATETRYVFDEGEQGQPAFVFERAGGRAYFSITDSELSGGKALPDWQRIEFSPDEFLAEYLRFRESFYAAVKAAVPHVADQWIRRRGRAGYVAPDGA